MSVEGKQRRVMLVRIPKLLPPPFKARQRSGLEVGEAVATVPEASTTS